MKEGRKEGKKKRKERGKKERRKEGRKRGKKTKKRRLVKKEKRSFFFASRPSHWSIFLRLLQTALFFFFSSACASRCARSKRWLVAVIQLTGLHLAVVAMLSPHSFEALNPFCRIQPWETRLHRPATSTGPPPQTRSRPSKSKPPLSDDHQDPPTSHATSARNMSLAKNVWITLHSQRPALFVETQYHSIRTRGT